MGKVYTLRFGAYTVKRWFFGDSAAHEFARRWVRRFWRRYFDSLPSWSEAYHVAMGICCGVYRHENAGYVKVGSFDPVIIVQGW